MVCLGRWFVSVRFGLVWTLCLAISKRVRKDSVKQRQRSVETIGIRQELRSPPWLVQSDTVGVDDEFGSLHWGTLFQVCCFKQRAND